MNNNKTTQSVAKKEARELAKLLGEKQHSAIGQIMRIIRLCGLEYAQEMYAAAIEIEANGGMMLPDNSRRRTPGGVFLYLSRMKLDDTMQKLVFRKSRKKRPLLSWKKRIPLIERLQTNQGQVKSMMVSFKGIPGHIEKRAEVVVVTLAAMPKRATLAPGMPTPPSKPAVLTLYVAPKEWEKIEAAAADPSNLLRIEGICAYDPETKSMPVFATSVMTEPRRHPAS